MPDRKSIGALARSSATWQWFCANVEIHEAELRRYLRRKFPRVEADDIIQDAYVRLFKMKHAQEIANVRTYLYSIVRNLALDQVRKAKAAPLENLPAEKAKRVTQDLPCSAELASRRQERDLFELALATLPDRCRAALRHHVLEGRTQRETAGKMGISERAVNSHIRTGLERVAAFLESRGVRIRKR